MSTSVVTVRDAARQLGLSYHQTRRLLHQQKLKGTQSGGRYGRLLVDAADLERLVRARRPRAI